MILVLGSGGREFALVWQLIESKVPVCCAPGSDAIAQIAPTFKFESFDELASLIREKEIEEVIVGPEAYLADGIADFLNAQGISVFGPSQSATRLESDKGFAKDFMMRNGIPTARSETFKDLASLTQGISRFRAPYVVKASGLAAGKGVWIGDDLKQALHFAETSLKEHPSVVVEEFLEGEELSYFLMIDGDQYLILGSAQDHKRLLDNDRGPNTGGMGTYSPVPLLTPGLDEHIRTEILQPCLRALHSENLKYRGFLFIGLMIVNQKAYVLEFNCRMGDPETQVLMRRLKTPLNQLIKSLKTNQPLQPQYHEGVALNVVVAAKGYPEAPLKGFELPGIENPPREILVVHSGTKLAKKVFTANGGRIFSVCALQPSLLKAQECVYPWIESLSFQDKISFRRDIGMKAYRHLQS